MPSAHAEEFRRAAMRLGFERRRQAGSHERWIHRDGFVPGFYLLIKAIPGYRFDFHKTP